MYIFKTKLLTKISKIEISLIHKLIQKIVNPFPKFKILIQILSQTFKHKIQFFIQILNAVSC